MIKAEKVNHRIAIKRVNTNIALLNSKDQTLASLYDVIFSRPTYTFLNVVNQYSYDEISYGEADKYNRLYASYFVKHIDEKEKYVGLLLENSKEWIYSFYGLLLGGYIPVLLSTTASPLELDYVIKKLDIKTVVTNQQLKVITINPFKMELPSEISPLNRAFADEIVFLTSGSTGMPKIVFYNGKEICEQIKQAQGIFKNQKGIDKTYKGYLKHLVVLPFYHIFGLVTVLLWFSFFNVTFVLPLSVNPKHLKQASLLTHPTHLFAVPLLYETIYQTVNNKCDTEKKKKKLKKALKTSYFLQKHCKSMGLSIVRNCMFKKYLNLIFTDSIRFCISGGAFLNPEALRLINLIGYPLMNGYGSTEIGITSLNKSKTIDQRLSSSLGDPFSSVSYKIENDYLLVKSPSSTSRLINGEGKEERLSHEEYINTYDKAKLVDGKYYLLGRDDEVVVLENGENISLALKEKELSLNKCQEYALVEKNHQIILIASYDKMTPLDAIREELKGVNNEKGFISQIYYTTLPLPKANSIKYKRHQLVELLTKEKQSFILLNELEKNEESLKEEYNEEMLNKIIDIYASIFNGEKISPNSHFYNDLNGDSLRYFMLLNKIEEEFKIEINISEASTAPYTPNEFLRRVRG